MSPPSVWGPPIWRFFHILAENIHEEDYNKLLYGSGDYSLAYDTYGDYDSYETDDFNNSFKQPKNIPAMLSELYVLSRSDFGCCIKINNSSLHFLWIPTEISSGVRPFMSSIIEI